jgi:hypothetical protein
VACPFVGGLLPVNQSCRVRAGAVTLAAFTALATLPLSASLASANTASSIGHRYHDKLDSRYSAHRLAQAAQGSGYAGTAYTNGRGSDDAWADGLNSSVFGLFGHANGGVFQLGEGTTDAEDPLLAAGLDTDVAPIYANVRFFSEYLPFIDIDDMRLLVLAGCYTATSTPSYGDFNAAAVQKGVDSIVTFPGLVYFPASEAGTAMSATVYSGNYFWDRFATHAQSGVTVATALARARTDLVAKEGNAGGWDRYVVRGAVASPGAVSLRPAGAGEPLNSQPLGINPYPTLTSLTVASSTWVDDATHGRITQVVTSEGVSYRTRADGTLLDLSAPTAASGPVKVDLPQAQTLAEQFLRDNVPAVDGSWSLVRSEEVSHINGDAVALLQFRPQLAGASGSQEVTVEVDRRTGAVTYLSHTRGSADTASFAVGQNEAVAAALDWLRQRGHSTAGRITATADTWHTSRWTVQVDRGLDGPFADVDRVTVDANTGQVIAHDTA